MKNNADNEVTVDNLPFEFKYGAHPDYVKDFVSKMNNYYAGLSSHPFLCNGICVEDFFCDEHPEIYILPKDKMDKYIDYYGDAIGIYEIILPFSSCSFYVDEYNDSVFKELFSCPAFLRLSGISQLGYLVPPKDQQDEHYASIHYLLPTFKHTRLIHSVLTAIMMEVVLARNGFGKEVRNPIVLTAACHDIAMPAGGDPIKNISNEFDEEENFALVMSMHGLDVAWGNKYKFNLGKATKWVQGHDLFGKLLDIFDKISYTALDCYELGIQKDCLVRQCCLKNPLVIDVWQDVRITENEYYFTNPERLYNFLLLRALEFKDLIFNPRCRALDYLIIDKAKLLYKKGIITKTDFLTKDNFWLEQKLSQYFPDSFSTCPSPDGYKWKKFNFFHEKRQFLKKIGDKFDHSEFVSSFTTGLDWPTMVSGKICTLRSIIKKSQIDLLEGLAESIRGYYVYYKE